MIVLVQSQSGIYCIPTRIQFISIPHPKSGLEVSYGIVDDRILELQSVIMKRHSSWFFDQRVSSNSALYLGSNLDPRFLIIPFLEKSKSRFCLLDQIIPSKIPTTNILSWKLDEVCDINDKYGDDMIVYRYNEEKVLLWLKSKVERTASKLFNQKLRDNAKNNNNCFANNFSVSAQSKISSNLNSKIDDNSSTIINVTSHSKSCIYIHILKILLFK